MNQGKVFELNSIYPPRDRFLSEAEIVAIAEIAGGAIGNIARECLESRKIIILLTEKIEAYRPLYIAAARLMAGAGLESHDFPCGCCVCEMAAVISRLK